MSYDPTLTPVDYMLVQGQPSPGVVVVSGDGPERIWQKRRGPGLSGAVAVFMGQDLGAFTSKITLSTSQDWIDWAAWKPLVDKPPYGKRPRALDVWHPWLEEVGIKSAVVQNVSLPEETDPGVYTITIKWLEFRKLKVTLAKPEASTETKSTDPVDKLIESLTAQVQELAK